MSDYSSNFPTQRPVFSFNANSGKLDSRISYTRSSSGTAFSSEKHLSSLNLLKYSTAFDNAAWNGNNIPVPTTGQTDPSGGTGGCILIADTTNGSHNKFQSQVTSGDLSFTVYAKPASGTMRMMLNLYNAANDWEVFLFDLVGGTPVAASGTSSTFSNVSATQTASGSGYYKCTIKATGSITSALVALNPNATTSGLDAYGDISFAGDNTAGITVAFASLSTVGSSDYNATTTQIHREFAPTLKTSAANEPRFEYAADGQSEGLLIEAQATNLYPNSSDMTGTAGARVNVDSNVAVGPDGALTADAIRLDSTNSNDHYKDYSYTAAASTVYTFSVYVKAAGLSYICVRPKVNFTATPYVFFNLSTGAVTGGDGVAESVGNGYYRCSVKATSSGATTSTFRLYVTENATTTTVTTGDSYRSVIGTGIQIEASSAPSSLISTSGSTATRSADSCSVVDATLFSSGEHTVIWEGDTDKCGDDPNVDKRFFSLSDTTTSNRLTVDYNDGTQVRLRNWADGNNDVAITYNADVTSGTHKVAATLKTNEAQLVVDGTRRQVDTSCVVGTGIQRLGVNTAFADAYQQYNMNGHCKRITYFNVALSQTEVEALTSNP